MSLGLSYDKICRFMNKFERAVLAGSLLLGACGPIPLPRPERVKQTQPSIAFISGPLSSLGTDSPATYINVITPDGRPPIKVGPYKEVLEQLVWSYDRKTLFYNATMKGQTHLYALDSQTGSVFYFEGYPSGSTSDKLIVEATMPQGSVYVLSNHGGQYDIWLLESSGQAYSARQITDTPELEVDVAISKQGNGVVTVPQTDGLTRLLFLSGYGGFVSYEQLLSLAVEVPNWSSDGESFVFVSPSESGSNIFRYDTETFKYTRLTDNGDDASPILSLDGTKIFFARGEEKVSTDGSIGFETYVYVMGTDGKNPKPLRTEDGEKVPGSPDAILPNQTVVVAQRKNGGICYQGFSEGGEAVDITACIHGEMHFALAASP